MKIQHHSQLCDHAYEAAHQAVVNNPYWYGDGPQMLGERFNAANTRMRADIFIDILHRAAKRRNERHLSQYYSRFAEELTCCHVEKCGSAKCPKCLRAFQQAKAAAHEAIIPHLGALYPGTSLYHVTIIPRDWFYPRGTLHKFDPAEFNRHLIESLKFAGLNQRLVGSIDFSLENSPSFGRYWQPHWHLSMWLDDPVWAKKSLLQEFPRFLKYDYPVVIDEAIDLKFLPYVHKVIKINDLLRTGRTHLPELLLALSRNKPLDFLVLNGLVLSAQDDGFIFELPRRI
jgi:hypothetical protein